MRISQTPAEPRDALQIISLTKLIKLHLDRGIEQTQLHKNFVCHCGRFGKSQDRWKEVRKIKVQVSERLDKLLDGGRLRISEIDLVVQLLAKRAPVECNERMFPANFTDDGVGDARAFTEASKV